MASNDTYLTERFILHPDKGLLDIAHDGRTVLHGASAQVTYRLGGEQKTISLAGSRVDCRVSHEAALLSLSNDDLTVTWHLSPNLNGASPAASAGAASLLFVTASNR